MTRTDPDVAFENATQPPLVTDTELTVNCTSEFGVAEILTTAQEAAAAGSSIGSAAMTAAGPSRPAATTSTRALGLTAPYSPTHQPDSLSQPSAQW